MSPGEILTAVSLGSVFLLGLLGWVTNRRANRTGEKKAETDTTVAQFSANIELNKYIDSRVDALVEERIGDVRTEITTLKSTDRTRTLAMTRILRSLAAQWPVGAPGPILDPVDISAIEETIPPAWLNYP